MQTHVEERSQVKRRIRVDIEAEKVRLTYDKVLRELSKKAKVKGFRPGKIPRSILEQYYGTQIASEVKNDLIQESFPEVLEETGLSPIAGPSIEDGALHRDEPFSYTIEMEVRPVFELNGYMGVSVEKELPDISGDSVDKKLEELREAHAQLISIGEDRAVQEGDYAVIDYAAFWNGKPLEKITGDDFTVLVGKGRFYPEVEVGIVGMKKDDETEITVDFDADFADRRLAGKTVAFRLRLKDVKKKELPDLNDEFAKTLGDEFTSLAVLRERVHEEITRQEEQRVDREAKNRLLKKIASTVDFEVPQVLINNEIEQSIASIKQSILRSGSRLESAGLSEERMRDELRPIAESKIKEDLVLGKIADAENITVDERDTAEGFQRLAAQTGKDPAALEQFYETNNLIGSFRDQLLKEKTLNHLLQGAKIISVKEISEEP
ncbi:MAG: trigger factor [Thermodesulfobacteriota bacterium]